MEQRLTKSDVDIADHLTEVSDPYVRIRRRIEGTGGDGNCIGRPTVSTNLDPWELPGTKPPTKEYTWRDPWLQLHM